MDDSIAGNDVWLDDPCRRIRLEDDSAVIGHETKDLARQTCVVEHPKSEGGGVIRTIRHVEKDQVTQRNAPVRQAVEKFRWDLFVKGIICREEERAGYIGFV